MTKELVIISGKGGTGKTSIVSSLSTLAQNKIMVDCDVDAADMHLIMKPTILKTTEFYSGKTAKIDESKCSKCGKCQDICRFNAIKDYKISAINCEGCGACYYQCPEKAITFEDTKSGEWFESNTRLGKLVHAKLGIGEENSGKLVSEIKTYARNLAKIENAELIIVDGSPGIGCPVIASISGASYVVVITEPTLSGLHDAERVLELTRHFRINAGICINKFDINPDMARKIEEFCLKHSFDILGKIPYDKIFTKAMIQEKTLIEYDETSKVSQEIKKIWQTIEEKLNGNEK